MDCFAALAMTVKSHELVMHAKAGIQYAAAYRFNPCRLGVQDRPVKPGDDS